MPVPSFNVRVAAAANDSAIGLELAVPTREPAVAEFHYAPQGVVAFAAEEDRRIRLLLGLGIEPDGVEGDKFAVEFRLVVAPQGLHRQHAFAQNLEAALVSRAVILHLLDVPAPANAEDETTPGELIKTGDRFGRDNGIALRHERDPSAEKKGSCGRRGER